MCARLRNNKPNAIELYPTGSSRLTAFVVANPKTKEVKSLRVCFDLVIY